MTPASQSSDVVFERLDDQLGFYERGSARQKKWYQRLKIGTLICGALLPATSGRLPGVTGALGVLIVIAEGLQQLFQFHANWITYRATAEALKHEKFLYLVQAGPYAEAANPRVLFAERIEALLSQENQKWNSNQQQAPKDKPPGPAAP